MTMTSRTRQSGYRCPVWAITTIYAFIGREVVEADRRCSGNNLVCITKVPNNAACTRQMLDSIRNRIDAVGFAAGMPGASG